MSAISFRPESREEAITHFHNLLHQNHIRLASELATSATSPSPTPFQPFVAAAEQIWAEVAHVLEPLLEGEDTRDASRLALLTVFKEDALDIAEEETFVPVASRTELYESIKRRLDLVLAFTQLRKIDDKAPFLVLDDLFALLKVSGCQAIFSFLESRSVELKLPLPADQERTIGLSLLRACNVLLARLNKAQDAVFCGRILAFMGSSFGLGARSGVNLRGDFNTGNVTVFEEGVEDEVSKEEEKKQEEVESGEGGDVEMADGEAKDEAVKAEEGGKTAEGKKELVIVVEEEEEEEGVVKDEMEEGETKDEPASTHSSLPKKPSAAVSSTIKPSSPIATPSATPVPSIPPLTPALTSNESFYTTFWSLQTYFADPTILASLTASTSGSSTPRPTFDEFRFKADRVIDVLAKETEKERVLRGSGEGGKDGSGKGKGREVALSGLDEVFMPKFLTSPGLLGFELADVSFRRQILVQFLILYNLLRSFSSSTPPPGKIIVQKMPGFSLSGQNDSWLNSSWDRVVKELRQTWPDGRPFTDSILAILKRESNWIRWKDHSCYPFEKPPLTQAHLVEARAKRRKVESAPPQPLAHPVGTPALSELWEEHLLNGLEDLENPRPQDTLASYAARLRRADLQADSRKRAHEKINGPDSTPKDDPVLLQIAENKASLTFRALRQVRSTNVHAFSTALKDTSKATNPDGYVQMLIDDEKARREAAAAAKAAQEEMKAQAEREKNGESAPAPVAVVAGGSEEGEKKTVAATDDGAEKVEEETVKVEGGGEEAKKDVPEVVASKEEKEEEGDVEMTGPPASTAEEVKT